MKKIKITYLFAILLTICLLKTPIKADTTTLIASGNCTEQIMWELNSDGKLLLTGSGEMADYNNPSDVPWKEYNQLIKTIYISDGISSIGSRSFMGCNSLQTISMADSITNIKEEAFYKCGSLSNIALSNQINHIGINAFQGTTFYNNSMNWEGPLLYIGKNLVACSRDAIDVVQIKSGTTCIGEAAFYGCKTIKALYIPETIQNIGKYAFSNSSISEVHLFNIEKWLEVELEDESSSPMYLSSIIDKHIYINGELITELEIPKSLKEIKSYSFYGFTDLHKIKIHKKVKYIGKSAFAYCKSLEKIYLPNSIKSIGEKAFFSCNSLLSVKLPSKLKRIEQSTFSNCISLTGVDIPEGLKSIGLISFSGCHSMANIYIPNTTTKVESTSAGIGPFFSCESLTINLERDDEPKGYCPGWNYCYPDLLINVIYNYTGSQAEDSLLEEN